MDCIDRRWEGVGADFDQALAEMTAQEGLPPYRVVVGKTLGPSVVVVTTGDGTKQRRR